MPKIRIVSDGSPAGTQVYAGVEPLVGIKAISWEFGVDKMATVTVEFSGVPVDVVGEYESGTDDGGTTMPPAVRCHEIGRHMSHYWLNNGTSSRCPGWTFS